MIGSQGDDCESYRHEQSGFSRISNTACVPGKTYKIQGQRAIISNMNIRTILLDSFHFYFGNIQQIALVCVPIIFIALLLQYLLFTIPEFEAAPFASLAVGLLFYPLFPIGGTVCLQRHVQAHACRFGVESHLPFFSLFHEHDFFCTHHEHRRQAL